MTRSEALKKMGVMAAGVPFLQQVVSSNFETAAGSGKFISDLHDDPVLEKAISELEYLTQTDKFYVQLRGKPILSEIPDARLSAIGLTRETWKLEIFPDHESNSEIGNPLTMERGNAFNWNDLMKLAETINNTPKVTIMIDLTIFAFAIERLANLGSICMNLDLT